MQKFSLLVFFSVLFLCCNSNNRDIVVVCYEQGENSFYIDSVITFCDTLNENTRIYSNHSSNFREIIRVDSVVSRLDDVHDTVSVGKSQYIVFHDEVRISTNSLMIYTYYSDDIIFHGVHSTKLGLVLAKFEYRQYIMATSVSFDEEVRYLDIEVNYAKAELDKLGGWSFKQFAEPPSNIYEEVDNTELSF